MITTDAGGSVAPSVGLASYTVTGPVANPDTFVRVAGLTWKTAITNLTANDTNTAGGGIGFSAVITPSTNTVPVSNDTQYVYYSGTNALADRFSYIITNSSGITATGTVTLTVSTNPVTGQALTISNAVGNVTASFAGIPGYSYTIQRATNVNFTGNITTLVTTNAPSAGLFKWVDTAPPTPAAYYRLRYNP